MLYSERTISGARGTARLSGKVADRKAVFDGLFYFAVFLKFSSFYFFVVFLLTF